MISIKKWATFVFAIFFTSIASITFGQDYTYDDAADAFTQGTEYAEANDFESAIEKFTEAAEIASTLGEQGEEVENRAKSQITTMSLRRLSLLANNREWEEAIAWVDRIEELDAQYGEGSAYERAYAGLPQFYFSWGNDLLREERNEEAIEMYEQAVELNANYTRAYYQLGLALRRVGDLEGSLDALDRSMELAEQQGDQDDLSRARSQARDYLIYRGSEATSDERFADAEEHLTRALEYDAESARLHYRLAELYNVTERYQDALEHANIALDYETGGATDMARIYFEIGVAHQALGNEAEACDAFVNAAHGDYRSAAEHELEYELDCDNWEERVGR